jgi:hypothetical protein
MLGFMLRKKELRLPKTEPLQLYAVGKKFKSPVILRGVPRTVKNPLKNKMSFYYFSCLDTREKNSYAVQSSTYTST